MAITPRTILTSAAPATVAVVSLYFFTVLGTSAFTCFVNSQSPADDPVVDRASSGEVLKTSNACTHVANRFGDDSSEWSEFAWINYAYCYDQAKDSAMAIQAATDGLDNYPRSEILYNLKGYHQIVTGDHAAAIDTLREGMDAVAHPRNGVMANNLAWAGLWEPRKMSPQEARSLYVRSLALSPEICETVHTALFVEFAVARQASGLQRYEALKRFSDLRARYNPCLDRLKEGDWNTVVEVVGAAVLFDNVDNTVNSDGPHPLMRSAVSTLISDHSGFSIDQLCSEAMPLADYHHDCVSALERSIRAHGETSRRHQQRNQRAAEVRIELQRNQYVPAAANDNNVILKQSCRN